MIEKIKHLMLEGKRFRCNPYDLQKYFNDKIVSESNSEDLWFSNGIFTIFMSGEEVSSCTIQDDTTVYEVYQYLNEERNLFNEMIKEELQNGLDYDEFTEESQLLNIYEKTGCINPKELKKFVENFLDLL